MKKRLLLPFLAVVIANNAFADNVAINNENFPDESFRQYVSSSFDKNHDGILSEEEIESVEEIYVQGINITNLKGIEHFTNLSILNCAYNQLTKLDVNKNVNLTTLNCAGNQLTLLDVSKNVNLTTINCDYNKLTRLDVSKNVNLTILGCYDNQLTQLDVSKNVNLTTLYCGNNQLTQLDVSKNVNLTALSCDKNQLTQLDVNNNINLTGLNCGYNKLTQLDVSKNVNLTRIDCDNNQLTQLDVSKNVNLQYLHCDNNQLTKLDVSNNTNLSHLYCSDNRLTKLDVSNNPLLWLLICKKTQLIALDLSKNNKLSGGLFDGNNRYFNDVLINGKSYVALSTLAEFGFDKSRIDASLTEIVGGTEYLCLGECGSADTELSLTYLYNTGNEKFPTAEFTISRMTGGAAGIDKVEDDRATTVNVYTLGGQLVRQNADADRALDGLQEGIYVVKGKKVRK